MRTITLTVEEARTYRLDVLEAEVRQAVEDGLTAHSQHEPPPPDWEIEWAQEMARKIAASWAMHRDGYVDFTLDEAASA